MRDEEQDRRLEEALARHEAVAAYLRRRRGDAGPGIGQLAGVPLPWVGGTFQSRSRAQLYRYLKAARQGRLLALYRKERADKGKRTAIPAELFAHCCALRQKFPQMGSAQIIETLVAEGVPGSQQLAASTLRRWLREEHLPRHSGKKPGTGQTGDPGVGKTAAVRTFCQALDAASHLVLYLADPALTPRGLYRLIGAQLGLEIPWAASECARAVRQALLGRRQAGVTPLLVLDEADELATATLAELRVLQNGEMDHLSPAAVVLVGAPLLRQRLRQVTLTALAQRVTAAYHLVGLTAAETSAYIELQLALDGTPAVIFTPATVEDVFHLTRGIPRLINRICQTALLGAASGESPVVEPRTVKTAAIDCGLA